MKNSKISFIKKICLLSDEVFTFMLSALMSHGWLVGLLRALRLQPIPNHWGDHWQVQNEIIHGLRMLECLGAQNLSQLRAGEHQSQVSKTARLCWICWRTGLSKTARMYLQFRLYKVLLRQSNEKVKV